MTMTTSSRPVAGSAPDINHLDFTPVSRDSVIARIVAEIDGTTLVLATILVDNYVQAGLYFIGHPHAFFYDLSPSALVAHDIMQVVAPDNVPAAPGSIHADLNQLVGVQMEHGMRFDMCGYMLRRV